MKILGNRCIVNVKEKEDKTKTDKFGFIVPEEDNSDFRENYLSGNILHAAADCPCIAWQRHQSGHDLRYRVGDRISFLLKDSIKLNKTDYLVPHENVFAIN